MDLPRRQQRRPAGPVRGGRAAEPAALRRRLPPPRHYPVALCRPDGRLDPAAVGWSRRPLHRCNLRGRWPRKKRWDFWGITTDTHFLAVTYGAADYLGTVAVAFLDYAVGRRVEHMRLVPLA